MPLDGGQHPTLPDAAGAQAPEASLEVDAGSPGDAFVEQPVDAGCSGLRCQRPSCATGTTSISGTAYAPNGTLPLYNVIVFVPAAELAPVANEVTCSQCGVGVSGDPIVTALSDAKGHFQLDNVPAGKNIPLVFQVGKWRRRVVLDNVSPCTDNPVRDPELTRLPKNRSEGDLPRIAVTTGECDQLACLLPKIGIDSTEFGLPHENKVVSFYAGGVGAYNYGSGQLWSEMPPARTLWDDPKELKKYDLAMFSCECDEDVGESASKDARSFAAVASYLDEGGRIFTTDFQYTWYKDSPDPKMRHTAAYPGGALSAVAPVKLDTSFPKGKALADWLYGVTPASTYGEVAVQVAFANIGDNDENTQVWGHSPDMTYDGVPTFPEHARFMTIATPVGVAADKQCGKAVHLDAHISSGAVDASFPAGCSGVLSEGEATFAFFFFDLASCIQPESEPPEPPEPPGLH